MAADARAFRQHRRAALDVLAIVRVPLVAAVEDVQLEEVAHARMGVAVGVDRPVLPLAREPELAPRADVLLGSARVARHEHFAVLFVAAGALRAENAVQLLHGEARDRVVLVHEDDRSPAASARRVPRAGRDHDRRHVVGILFGEAEDLLEDRLAAGNGDVGRSHGERRDRDVTARQLVREPDTGLVLAECFLHDRNQAAEWSAGHPDRSLHLLAGLIARQVAHVPFGARRCRAHERGGKRRASRRPANHRTLPNCSRTLCDVSGR